MNRALFTDERSWIEATLAQEDSLSDDKKRFYLEQLPHLRVSEECDCGNPKCRTVRFADYAKGCSTIIAQGVVHENLPEQLTIILFVNKDNDRLCEIETVTL